MKFWSLIFSFVLAVQVFASSWELEKNKDGIKVFTRETSGTDVKEFKVNATMNASRMAIAKIVTKAGDFMNWIPKVENSRVLEVISPTKRIIYYEVGMPWPLDNRDCVMDFWVETDNDNNITWVKFKENTTAKEEVEGIVRMKKSSGFWKLTSISDTQTEVDYQFAGDPGGNLPAWLVNMFLVDTPYDMFVTLREKVE